MIAVEAPGWLGATREHTDWYVTEEQRRQPGCIGREVGRLPRSRAQSLDAGAVFAHNPAMPTGPKLRAECKIHADGMIICECHYSGGYMGTCAPSEGPLCGLPDGCCEVYVP